MNRVLHRTLTLCTKDKTKRMFLSVFKSGARYSCFIISDTMLLFTLQRSC